MKWPLPLLLGYLLLAFQPAVGEALRLGRQGPTASIIMPLAVFIALFAGHRAAIWSALALGLAIDLTTLRGTDAMVIAGPHALGYAAAAYFVLTSRPLVMRRNPFTLMLMSILAEGLSSVVVVFVFAVRRGIWWNSWADVPRHALLSELGDRLLGSLYTGLPALALSLVFFPLLPWFGFQDSAGRRPAGTRP
jgi:rod shape-determining protein MreD